MCGLSYWTIFILSDHCSQHNTTQCLAIWYDGVVIVARISRCLYDNWSRGEETAAGESSPQRLMGISCRDQDMSPFTYQLQPLRSILMRVRTLVGMKMIKKRLLFSESISQYQLKRGDQRPNSNYSTDSCHTEFKWYSPPRIKVVFHPFRNDFNEINTYVNVCVCPNCCMWSVITVSVNI